MEKEIEDKAGKSFSFEVFKKTKEERKEVKEIKLNHRFNLKSKYGKDYKKQIN